MHAFRISFCLFPLLLYSNASIAQTLRMPACITLHTYLPLTSLFFYNASCHWQLLLSHSLSFSFATALFAVALSLRSVQRQTIFCNTRELHSAFACCELHLLISLHLAIACPHHHACTYICLHYRSLSPSLPTLAISHYSSIFCHFSNKLSAWPLGHCAGIHSAADTHSLTHKHWHQQTHMSGTGSGPGPWHASGAR